MKIFEYGWECNEDCINNGRYSASFNFELKHEANTYSQIFEKACRALNDQAAIQRRVV